MTNQNNRKSFIIHKDSLVILNEMSNEQAGIFIKAIKFYQEKGHLPDLDFGLKMAITPFINQFQRDEELYKKTCEARKGAGSLGGKQKVANASKRKQKVANLADSDSKNNSDSDSKSKNNPDNDKIIIKGKEINLPEFIDKDLFIAFIDMRIKIKKPLTEVAIGLLIKKLTKFENKQVGFANQALGNSIEGSWQGVFEPRQNNYNNNQGETKRFMTAQEIKEYNNKKMIADFIARNKGGNNNE
jgi:hypothetical protein